MGHLCRYLQQGPDIKYVVQSSEVENTKGNDGGWVITDKDQPQTRHRGH